MISKREYPQMLPRSQTSQVSVTYGYSISQKTKLSVYIFTKQKTYTLKI